MKWGYLFTCHFCHKQLFRSRKAAKRAYRVAHPGETTLNAYECPIYTGWHYGNLPPGGRDVAKEMQERKLKELNGE